MSKDSRPDLDIKVNETLDTTPTRNVLSRLKQSVLTGKKAVAARLIRSRDVIRVPFVSRLVSTMILCFYALSIIILISVPLKTMLSIGQASPGSLVADHRTFAMILLGFVTFVWSLAVGAFIKLLIPRVTHYALLVFGVALVLATSSIFDGVRSAVSQLRPSLISDDMHIGAFVTYWIVLLGYTSKPVWDALRDRLEERLKNTSIWTQTKSSWVFKVVDRDDDKKTAEIECRTPQTVDGGKH